MGYLPKHLLVTIQAIFLAGCVGGSSISVSPEVSDFPNIGLDYRIEGSRDNTRQTAINFLTDKDIPYRQEIQEPHTYVITAYIKEPDIHGDRRVRRTAYRISLREDAPDSPCTYASVTWLVESKGIRERTWRTMESDGTYTPNSLKEVKSLFAGRRCQ